MQTHQVIAWVEGKILPAHEARIPVLDHGFLFGDGIFEGIRLTPTGIFRFEDHMKRLSTAARAVGIDVPGGMERVRDVARETTRAWGPREGYLRLIVSRGVGGTRTRSRKLHRACDHLHRGRHRHALAREGSGRIRSHHIEPAATGRRRSGSAREEPELPEQRAREARGESAWCR